MFLKEKGYSPNSLQRQPDCQVAAEVMKAAFTYNPDFEVSIIECKWIKTINIRETKLIFDWLTNFLAILI